MRPVKAGSMAASRFKRSGRASQRPGFEQLRRVGNPESGEHPWSRGAAF